MFILFRVIYLKKNFIWLLTKKGLRNTYDTEVVPLTTFVFLTFIDTLQNHGNPIFHFFIPRRFPMFGDFLTSR